MKKAAKGRPRKKFGHKKEHVTFRVTRAEKSTYERAADAAEMDFSDWLRAALAAAARRQLGEEGQPE